MALVACSSSTPATPATPDLSAPVDMASAIAPFLGSWSTMPSASITCPNGTGAIPPLDSTFIVAAGSTPTEVITRATYSCTLVWQVSGNVATLAGSQSCMVADSGGGWNATYSSGTLTLDPAKASISYAASGTLVFIGPLNCTFTQSESWSR
jgi:hypothetical protein